MLRHPLGPFTVDAVDRSKEPTETLPKLPPPVKVTYRRDGDLSAVVEAVKKYPRVNLVAAVGSGKSTVIPIALAEALGILVVHTIPAHHSARYNALYLGSQRGGDRFTFVSDINSDLPQRGVAVMTNAYFFSRMCTDRMGECPNFLLYMDENHESDCCTSVLRECATKFSCVKHVVFATATSEPGMELTAHLPSKRKVLTYTRVPTQNWSANDHGKPWSASQITQNTIIFIERPAAVQRLMGEYREHGFEVHVLGSRTSDEAFDRGFACLRDVRGPVTILMLDYSCRSSLTIPRTFSAIESGEVALASTIDGAPGYLYRDAYDFETQQALARIGRCDGETVTLYKPADRAKSKMCDLEALEGDAANLMYRMLGFRPPMCNGIFEEGSGPVPIDLVGAFQGNVPLKLFPPESREPWVKPGFPSSVQVKTTDAYRFQPVKGVGPRPMSCNTVLDSAYPRSPTPKFDKLNAIEEIDSVSFKEFVESREASPTLSPVQTLSSRSFDNVSALSDDEGCLAFAKPKRVAQRVIEARKAMEKELPSLPVADIGTLSGNVVQDTDDKAVKLAEQVLQIRGHANKAFDEMARNATQVKRGARNTAFVGDKGQNAAFDDLLQATSAQGKDYTIPDEMMGTYYYYHGMDAAPNISRLFLGGFDGLVQFCQSGNAIKYSKVLPESERLYAIKILLDRYNFSTARVFGIQRILTEIRGRPASEFQDLLKPDEFSNTLAWAINESGLAHADIMLSKSLMGPFLNKPLDKMSNLEHLEHAVIHEVIKKFERAAVVKDPDKMLSYFEEMNNATFETMRNNAVARR